MVERHRIVTVSCYVILALGVVFAIGPLYIGFCAASAQNRELMERGLPLVPSHYLAANIHTLAQDLDIWRMLFNSFIVAGIVTIGKLALSSVTAYAVVYFRSPWRHFIFWSVLLTLLLPLEVRIIPTYAIAADLLEPFKALLRATHLAEPLSTLLGIRVAPSLSLLDTYAGLSLPMIASATGTFLFRQFYRTVPPELVEAARIDGVGPIRFFVDILLPLSKTNLAALGTIAFISSWKEYVWPLVATNQSSLRTIAIGVANFFPTDAGQLPDWSLVMAAALLAWIPPMLVIALLQRWFVKGVVDAAK